MTVTSAPLCPLACFPEPSSCPITALQDLPVSLPAWTPGQCQGCPSWNPGALSPRPPNVSPASYNKGLAFTFFCPLLISLTQYVHFEFRELNIVAVHREITTNFAQLDNY